MTHEVVKVALLHRLHGIQIACTPHPVCQVCSTESHKKGDEVTDLFIPYSFWELVSIGESTDVVQSCYESEGQIVVDIALRDRQFLRGWHIW